MVVMFWKSFHENPFRVEERHPFKSHVKVGGLRRRYVDGLDVSSSLLFPRSFVFFQKEGESNFR